MSLSEGAALSEKRAPWTFSGRPLGASGVLELDVLGASQCVALVERLSVRGDWQGSIFPEGAERGREFIAVDPLDCGLPGAIEIHCDLAAPARYDLHRAICARYHEGDRFGLHSDGPSINAAGAQSTHTLMVYLSDVIGGETYFSDLDFAIAPRTGIGLIFGHDLRHAALPVHGGVKYILHAPLFPSRSPA